MRYVRKLDFFETPDYDYIRRLFYDLMAKNGWHCDWRFDWTERQPVLKVYTIVLCNTICRFFK